VARGITRTELSKKKRRLFLDILSKTGQVTEAARAVGYTSTQYLHLLRRNDEEFAEQWALAVEGAKDVLEAEAVRRAHEGVLEPDYYKGSVVGYTPKYSDTLLMFVLKKLDPAYRDTGRSGDVNVNFGVAIMPMQAKDDNAWEARAIEMHSNQKIITLEEKPKENHMIRASITRGD
jgi:hypothetical protein